MMSEEDVAKSDKETIYIDKLAEKIVNAEMEGFAITLLQLIKPISFIGGELAYFYLAPFLPLLSDYGYDFLDIFEKRENIEKLIKRVEQLYNEKEVKNKANKNNILSKLKKMIQYKK